MLALGGLAVVALAGCASNPISPGMREQAKPLTINAVESHPDTTMGTAVIWGGRIVRTEVTPNGGSVYILQYPLHPNDKPQESAVPIGQFVATHEGPIDLSNCKAGNFVTVAGWVKGVEKKPLPYSQYSCPAIDIAEIHVWVRPPPSTYAADWGYVPMQGEQFQPHWPPANF